MEKKTPPWPGEPPPCFSPSPTYPPTASSINSILPTTTTHPPPPPTPPQNDTNFTKSQQRLHQIETKKTHNAPLDHNEGHLPTSLHAPALQLTLLRTIIDTTTIFLPWSTPTQLIRARTKYQFLRRPYTNTPSKNNNNNTNPLSATTNTRTPHPATPSPLIQPTMTINPPNPHPPGDPTDDNNPFGALKATTDSTEDDDNEDTDDTMGNEDTLDDIHDTDDNNMNNDDTDYDNFYDTNNNDNYMNTSDDTPNDTKTSNDTSKATSTHSTTNNKHPATKYTHNDTTTATTASGINSTKIGVHELPNINTKQNIQHPLPTHNKELLQRILQQTPKVDLTSDDIPKPLQPYQTSPRPPTPPTPSPQSYAETAKNPNNNNKGWTLVGNQNKQNPKPPPSTPQKDENEIWDMDDQRLLDTSDDTTKQRRTNEGRNNIDRPLIWFNWVLPTDVKLSSTPNVLEFEHVLDTLITATDLPFSIDRAWLRSKRQGMKIKGKEHMITYAALCPTPSSPPDTNKDNDRLYQLNNTLFQLFHTDNALAVEDPDAIFNHCKFAIPQVNDNGQALHFLLKGLDPSLLLSDKFEEIFTQRKLAADIIALLKTHLKLAFPSTPLPHCLDSIDEHDILQVASLVSVRRMIFDDKRKPPNERTPLPILAIVMSDRHHLANELKDVIHNICHTNKTPLFIGGGKIQLHLVPVPTKEMHAQRSEFFVNIHEFNKAILPDVPLTSTLLHRHIGIPQHLIFDYELFSDLVNFTLTDCIGIFVNLCHGLLEPTLTCIFKQSMTTKFKRYEDLVSDIEAAFQNSPGSNLPPPAHAESHHLPYTINTTSTSSRGGRGGQSGQRKSLFKASTISSFIDSSKDDPWHAICNGIGGIATANLYKCHFDNSGLRTLTNLVPFERHFSYPTKEQAFKTLQTYYPWIKTYDDLDKMNANAPLNASNLNNPSPLIRQAVGDYERRRNSPADMFWTDNLTDPLINTLRTACTQRMKALKASPTDSCDFLDPELSTGELNYPVTSITLQCLSKYKPSSSSTTSSPTHTPSLVSSPYPLHQPMDKSRTNTNSTIEVTHVRTTSDQHDDDAVSQLSVSGLSVSAQSASGSALQSSPKRPRHTSTTTLQHTPQQRTQPTQPPTETFTFINFITSANTHPNDLRTIIATAYQKRTTDSSTDDTQRSPPFPSDAVSSYIHFSMIPGQPQYKLGHIQIINAEHSQEILNFIKELPAARSVNISHRTPPTAFAINQIDESQPTHPPHPLNCRFIGCQLHNQGIEPPKEILPDNHLTTMEEHGLLYHHDLIYLLPQSSLNNIGWHCCPGCNTRIFTATNFNTHKRGCSDYLKHTLIESCPPHKVQQLLALIEANTDLITIKGQIYDWITNPDDPDL